MSVFTTLIALWQQDPGQIQVEQVNRHERVYTWLEGRYALVAQQLNCDTGLQQFIGEVGAECLGFDSHNLVYVYRRPKQT